MKLFGLEVRRQPGRHREGAVARAAVEPVYSGGDYGWTSVVPTLQLSLGRKTVDYSSDIDKNPLLGVPIVQTAIRMGALPLKVYELDTKTGNREESSDHPGAALLRRPNPAMSKSLFVAGTIQSILAFRQAAWLKTRETPDGPPVELWPVAGWGIRLRRDRSKLIGGFEVSTANGWEKVDERDVCFFRLLPSMSDWATGGGAADFLPSVATLGNTAINALNDLFANGFLERFALTHPGTISEGAIKRIAAQMRGTRNNAGEVPFFEEGIKPESLGAPPNDEALIRALEHSLAFIRQAYGFPLDDADDTLFYSRAVQPLADCLEQEMERSLFTEWSDRPAFPEFGFRELLKGSPSERIELHARGILSMQETPNEARKEENKPPLAGGDTLFGPLNVSPVQELLLEGRRPEFRGTTRRKDTAGSLGGDFVEGGKGTLPTESSPQAPVGRANGVPVFTSTGVAEGTPVLLGRSETNNPAARIAGRAENWQVQRERITSKQAEALSNRLRGVVKRQQRVLRGALLPGAIRAGGERPLPSSDELLAAISYDSQEIVSLIAQFSRQVGEEAVRNAAELVAAEIADLEASITEAIASRAEVIASRFAGVQSEVIAGAIQNAVTAGLRVEDFAAQLIEDFGQRSVALADGIARTEMAWAYEQSAMREWANAGFEAYEIRFGGGPCSTGICEKNAAEGPYVIGGPLPGNVGSSFSLADAPPYHPSCTCYALPVVPEGIVGG